MQAVALPEVEAPSEGMAAYHYLLLGELRMLLEEPSDNDEARRWLLAVLDRLLARLPRQTASEADRARFVGGMMFTSLSVQLPWMQKLRRLRDRIAHRMPFQILANEIRCDLRLLFDQQLSFSGAEVRGMAS